MDEIDLWVMNHTPRTAEIFQPLLKQFEAQSRIHVKLTCLDWVPAQAELNRVAMRGYGPDVSEIGTTWVSELIAMNALRPFEQSELTKIGKPQEFSAAAWDTVRVQGDDHVWAIPWHAETYIIHYRKDLLRQAGVAEATAFQTHAQLEQTAERLKVNGVPVPVELTLGSDLYGTLHALASWVWGYGGDFCSLDGKRVLFDQPAALAGIRSYFGLVKYLSSAGRRLMAEKGATSLFRKGQSAITFGTLSLTRPASEVAPEVAQNWGAAILPKPCFVGGSNLVIWNHTHHERAAVDLVRFLMTASSLTQTCLPRAALPPRLSLLNSPAIAADPMLGVMGSAIQTGRSYPTSRLWGLLEAKLLEALLAIGADILAHPESDLDVIIRRHIVPTAEQLNLLLSQ